MQRPNFQFRVFDIVRVFHIAMGRGMTVLPFLYTVYKNISINLQINPFKMYCAIMQLCKHTVYALFSYGTVNVK